MSMLIIMSIFNLYHFMFLIFIKYQLRVCYINVKLTIKQSMKLVVNYNIWHLIKFDHERLNI